MFTMTTERNDTISTPTPNSSTDSTSDSVSVKTPPPEAFRSKCDDEKESMLTETESTISSNDQNFSDQNSGESSTEISSPPGTTTLLPPDFEAGDHVYVWNSTLGIPFAYQRHGILLSTAGPSPQIAEFYPDKQTPIQSVSLEIFAKRSKLRKVKYSAGFVPRLFYRAGTVASAPRDDPKLVLSRTQFLLNHPEIIPKYHALSSNSECVSVFCSTGSFLTLQSYSFLHIQALGQAKGAFVTGGVVAGMTTTVTVPSSGILGSLGFTTTATVPLMTAQPWLVPVLVAYGMVALLPLELLRRYRNQWKEAEKLMNEEFWKVGASQEILDEFWMKKNEEVVKEFFEGEEKAVEDLEQEEKMSQEEGGEERDGEQEQAKKITEDKLEKDITEDKLEKEITEDKLEKENKLASKKFLFV